MDVKDIVRPMNLQRMAGSIAANYGDKGAIILTYGDDGIRVGVSGLTELEAQKALCVGIYHNLDRCTED